MDFNEDLRLEREVATVSAKLDSITVTLSDIQGELRNTRTVYVLRAELDAALAMRDRELKEVKDRLNKFVETRPQWTAVVPVIVSVVSVVMVMVSFYMGR